MGMNRGHWVSVGMLICGVCLLTCSSVPCVAEVNPSPHETLVLMRERIQHDLDRAKEVRGKAMLQKSRLQTIIEKAREGTQDPHMDKEIFNQILAGAPAGIQDAEQALTKTEHTIKDLELRMKWTERAITNLHSALKPDKGYDPKNALGFGMVLGQPPTANVRLLRHGQSQPIPLGDNTFRPGDEIVSDQLGQTTVCSLGSLNYAVAVGPKTRLKLEQDEKTTGTLWSLSEGVIHYVPLGVNSSAVPARVRTPDAIVQGSPGSAFDVRVNEKGETSVEAYQGRVAVQEPAKGVSYFVDSKEDRPTTNHWWEQE